MQEKVDRFNLNVDISHDGSANFFEGIQNAVAITNEKSHVIYCNPAYTRVMGYTRDEMLGESTGILHSGRHKRDFYEAMWKQIKNNGYWEGEIWDRRKSGDIFPAYLTISRLTKVDSDGLFYIGILSDISYIKKDIDKKYHLAYYDPLTELPNRVLFSEKLSQALDQGGRHPGTIAAVFFMDLDKFKQANDSYGHVVGDELLVMVAKRLSEHVRKGDVVARFGGDEFAALVTSLTTKSEIQQLAQRFIDVIQSPFMIEGHEIFISISIGISLFPVDAGSPQELLLQSDKAMYAAKQSQCGVKFISELV